MKTLLIVGVLLIVLGVLAFTVPVPQKEEHSVKIGGAKFGVQTEDSQKLPTPVGVVLVGAGVVVLVLGARKK